MAMSPELEQQILAQDIHGFDEIEAGHYVLVGCNCSLHENDKTLSRVDRITKTQIVIDGDKFHRPNGRALGNARHCRTITIIDAELLLKMKINEAKRALRSMQEQVNSAVSQAYLSQKNDQATLDKLNKAYSQACDLLVTLGGGK